MTQDDWPGFAEVLGVLGETFEANVSEIRARAYFEALEDLDLDAIRGAVRVLLRTCTYFPKPVEIRRLVDGGSAEDRGELAWADLRAEIRRVGWCGTPQLAPETERAMTRVFGSWRRACETVQEEGPEAIGQAKRFLSAYAAGSRVDDSYEALTLNDVAPNVRAFIREHMRALPPKRES